MEGTILETLQSIEARSNGTVRVRFTNVPPGSERKIALEHSKGGLKKPFRGRKEMSRESKWEIRAVALAVSKWGECCPKRHDSANLELLFSSFTLIIHNILVEQNATKASS